MPKKTRVIDSWAFMEAVSSITAAHEMDLASMLFLASLVGAYNRTKMWWNLVGLNTSFFNSGAVQLFREKHK